MQKRLIINADDFGYKGNVVSAIIRLYEAGILKSTTAMTNSEYWSEGAQYLRSHTGFGAGVHLVITEGYPVLSPDKVPSLVDSRGHFIGQYSFFGHFHIKTAELKLEWKAQIERFIKDTERLPDHLDLHTFYGYLYFPWFRVSLELANEYGTIPVRMPFDSCWKQKNMNYKIKEVGAHFKFPKWFIRLHGLRYRNLLSRYNLKYPDYFEMSFSKNGNRKTDYLLNLLENLPSGITELLVHPGMEGSRKEEYNALLDQRVQERISNLGINLINFGYL